MTKRVTTQIAMIDAMGPQRLRWLHAVLFAFGVLTAPSALSAATPTWFLICGPCWMLSALVIFAGLNAALSEVPGQMLWAALGPSRMISIRLRAITCLLLGAALTACGVYGLLQDIVSVDGASSIALK